jgi:hypothetical protein
VGRVGAGRGVRVVLRPLRSVREPVEAAGRTRLGDGSASSGWETLRGELGSSLDAAEPGLQGCSAPASVASRTGVGSGGVGGGDGLDRGGSDGAGTYLRQPTFLLVRVAYTPRGLCGICGVGRHGADEKVRTLVWWQSLEGLG